MGRERESSEREGFTQNSFLLLVLSSLPFLPFNSVRFVRYMFHLDSFLASFSLLLVSLLLRSSLSSPSLPLSICYLPSLFLLASVILPSFPPSIFLILSFPLFFVFLSLFLSFFLCLFHSCNSIIF